MDQRGKHLEKHTKPKHMNWKNTLNQSIWTDSQGGKDSVTHLSSRRNEDKCLSSTAWRTIEDLL